MRLADRDQNVSEPESGCRSADLFRPSSCVAGDLLSCLPSKLTRIRAYIGRRRRVEQ
jgi:hypothetical protein